MKIASPLRSVLVGFNCISFYLSARSSSFCAFFLHFYGKPFLESPNIYDWNQRKNINNADFQFFRFQIDIQSFNIKSHFPLHFNPQDPQTSRACTKSHQIWNIKHKKYIYTKQHKRFEMKMKQIELSVHK